MTPMRRHPFLLFGLVTYALFALVAAFGGEAGFIRILIVPAYLVWLLLTMIQVALFGPGGLPGPLAPVVFVFDLVAGLAPYALADYLLNRRRRARNP